MIGLILWLIVIAIITFNASMDFLFIFVIIPLLTAVVFGVFELSARLTNKRK